MQSAQYYTPAIVEDCLTRAGRTLMALRVPGCRPGGYRSGMPDVLPQGLAAEFGADYLLRAEVKVDIDPPLSSEVTAMDRSMGWIATHLPGETPAAIRQRRVMLSRCLVHPRTDKHVATYRSIGERVGVSHEHVRVLWQDGLDRIAIGLNRRGEALHPSCAGTLARIRSMAQLAQLARSTVARDLEPA